MIKISIIVPIYNVERYLDRCMQSLLNQTLEGIEIIMVDDESPDHCPQLCEDYKAKYPNVKVVHKKNGGLGFARNSGLEVAEGEYVAFIDSDDFVDTDMFQNLYEYGKNNNCDAVFCGYNIYRDAEHVRRMQENSDYVLRQGADGARQVLLDMVGPEPDYHSDAKLLMSVWRAIYSRKVIEENHIRFVSERVYIAEDIMWHLDFLPCCKCVGLIPQTHYYYCMNGTSLTRTYRADRFQKELFLYHAQEEKLLQSGFDETDFRVRLNRQLFMKTRVCISQQVAFINQLGYLKTRKNIKEIATVSELQTILRTYPYKLLPLRHKLFFLLVRFHLYDMIIMLFKIKNK